MANFAEYLRSRIVGTFMAGLVVLLPVVLTFLVIDWIVSKLYLVVGPGSVLGTLFTSSGTAVVGSQHQTTAFWVGVVLVLVLVWALGVGVRSAAGRGLDAALEKVVGKFPFVRSIYKVASTVTNQIRKQDDESFAGMQVCVCRFGGPKGAAVMGLLTSEQEYDVAGERRKLVYLPTSPLPMSGGLVLISEDCISRLPDVSVESLMRIYFSLGTLAPGTLAPAPVTGSRDA